MKDGDNGGKFKRRTILFDKLDLNISLKLTLTSLGDFPNFKAFYENNNGENVIVKLGTHKTYGNGNRKSSITICSKSVFVASLSVLRSPICIPLLSLRNLSFSETCSPDIPIMDFSYIDIVYIEIMILLTFCGMWITTGNGLNSLNISFKAAKNSFSNT